MARAGYTGGAKLATTSLAIAVIALVAVAFLWSSEATANSDDEWIIEGGGWGHGIGLSQYGAYGMALDGFEADEILDHYYSGAFLVQASASLGTQHWVFGEEALWIGLEQNELSVDLEAFGGTVDLCQKGDGTENCVNGVTVTEGHLWRVEVVPGSNPIKCQLSEPAASPPLLPEGDCDVDVTWTDDVDLNNPGAATRVRVNGGRQYAHGSIRIRPNEPEVSIALADAFHVSVSVGLEDYLYGIGEMPSSWRSEALAAQASIARSFGVAAATSRAPDGALSNYRIRLCACHLDDSSIDQNYVGWSKESEGTNAFYGKKWVGAVDATTGLVLNHPSTEPAIISTYYSSSTGGGTENKEDIWGGAPLAHLRSVDDHWAIEPEVNNPYATWSVAVSQPAMLSALAEGWDVVVSAKTIAGPPGTVIEFTGTVAGVKVTTTRTGNWFRSKFSVRSPYVAAVVAPWTIPPFTDIGGNVHYDSIAYIWQQGITKGCNPPDNDLYCPSSGVTRGQMAAFLTRSLNLPAASEDHFTDDGASIFENDINRIAEAGITKGCNPPDNDRFCPERKVSRAEMAAFLVRAFGYTDPGEGDLFTDDDGLIFEQDIDKLGTAGITKGCHPPDNTMFCPNATLTRAAMATFLFRALG
ncbi:MAG: hypothetical protein DWP92_04770 [Armatimonadetes bacterium]|nr:MAG: hypothetical protein DWP92_04770 [Armatimonadota bacterium]